MQPPKLPGYTYIGDVDLTYGGVYYGTTRDTLGHVIRVVDGSDMGEDGTYYVESLQIFLRGVSALRESLRCCGYRLSAEPNREGRRLLALMAAVSYGHYDPANEFPSHHTCRMRRETGLLHAIERYAR